MCGLAGLIRLDGSPVTTEDTTILKRMVRSISYRGPDDTTFYSDGPLAVGFNRLAIIDELTGQQPFFNGDKTVAAFFNGEIFNHGAIRRSILRDIIFSSRSDGAILPFLYERYGKEMVEHLRGMYGIVLWDSKRRELLLVRDRLGIKPLFMALSSGLLLFASEIKALLVHPACPRSFNWEAALGDPWISEEPALESSRAPSFFRGIDLIHPGTIVSANANTGEIGESCYWSYDSFLETPVYLSTEEWVAKYEELLDLACSDCSQSDSEVGLMLSGGIDSAAVAAFSRPYLPDLKTFSILSRSTYANGDVEGAMTVARHLGLHNSQIVFREGQNDYSFDHWRHIVETCESPLCGAEQLFKYNAYRYVRKHHPQLKVMLLGQGSDELNGGYSTMIAPPNDQSWLGFMSSLRAIDRSQLLGSRFSKFKNWEHFLGAPVLGRQLIPIESGQSDDFLWRKYLRSKQRDLQIFNLWLEDRMAAGVSIENRVPFLDHRLVELCLSVPASMRGQLFWDKHIVRESVRDRLPKESIERPKVPFFYGEQVSAANRMMLGVLGKNAEGLDFILDEGDGRFLDRDALHQAFKGVWEDPEATEINLLVRLVNMVVLHKMASDARLTRWPEGRERIETAIETSPKSDPIDVEALLCPVGAGKIDFDTAVVLEEDFSLTHTVAGCEADAWSIVQNGTQIFAIPPDLPRAWLEVLKASGSGKSIRTICRNVSCDPETILPFIRRAFRAGVVRLEDTGGIKNSNV